MSSSMETELLKSGIEGEHTKKHEIIMCENNQCPLRLRCYRFMAEPVENQVYARYKPEIECDKMICNPKYIKKMNGEG